MEEKLVKSILLRRPSRRWRNDHGTFLEKAGTTAVPHNCPPFREGGTAEARAVVGRTAPPRERRRLTLLLGVEPYERGRPCWRGIQESWCTAPSWTPARRRRAAASAYTVRST